MHINNRLGLIETVETMLNQQRRLDQVANNIANADTVGFRRVRTSFHEVLVRRQDELSRVGKGLSLRRDPRLGPLRQTGNPLDVAIEGRGYFRIETADGPRYTRAGNFRLDRQGRIVTQAGDVVAGESGAIDASGGRVDITAAGLVLVNGEERGRLRLVDFPDGALENSGGNLFRLKDPELGGSPAADAKLAQGYLEGSNVESMLEMTGLIDITRIYEAQQKVIGVIDDLDRQAVSSVGRLNP